VQKPAFGPESDLYSHALAIVLNFVGQKETKYHDILCNSGRGFKNCWNTRFFFWDDYMPEPHPDPEYYLRTDYASARSALSAAGWEHEIIANKDCTHPAQNIAIQRLAGGDDVRANVIAGISEDERPILALFSVSSTPWMPEWSIITGYDDGGSVITGWSPFQDSEEAQAELDKEPDGYFRKQDWEKDTVVVVKLLGESRKTEGAERTSIEQAVEFSQSSTKEEESWGFAAYDAWADAVANHAKFKQVTDATLKGRLQYHSHFIGHLAAQKWYSSVYLKEMRHTPWTAGDILHASAHYAKIHELMWEIWKLAGGYWRDIDEEVAKFRDKNRRAEIADIIRLAGESDRAAVRHLVSALEVWDKTHKVYIDS
jgi:hypothetical protein